MENRRYKSHERMTQAQSESISQLECYSFASLETQTKTSSEKSYFNQSEAMKSTQPETNWYDDCVSSDDIVLESDSLDDYIEDPKPIASPYKCTVILNAPEGQSQTLKDIYSPLLQWIDPSFKIFRIREGKDFEITNVQVVEAIERLKICGKGLERHLQWKSNGYTDKFFSSAARVVDTQSLSILLFLDEDSPSELTATACKKFLRKSPWKFHHKIELASKKDLTPVARQDFYQINNNLPLWCINPVLSGKECLRFTIFTSNMKEMREFYSRVAGKKLDGDKHGFYCFNLYSQPGFDIQLALKHSPQLNPQPLKSAVLEFKLDDIKDVKPYITSPLIPRDKDSWLTCDPDGNLVILTHDNWDDLTWSVRDDVTDCEDSSYESDEESDVESRSDVSSECSACYNTREYTSSEYDSAYGTDPIRNGSDVSLE